MHATLRAQDAARAVEVRGPVKLYGTGAARVRALRGVGTIVVGSRRYDGLSDRELTRRRRERSGFVLQFFKLLGSLTAEENVVLPACIARRHDAALRRRARDLLTRVGPGERAGHLPASSRAASSSASRSHARCCSLPTSWSAWSPRPCPPAARPGSA
jgi:hypothetical protein